MTTFPCTTGEDFVFLLFSVLISNFFSRIYRTPNNRDFFQFFDVIGSRQPARFDAEFGERPAVQINYMEFDNGSQNKSIFQIPSEILSVCNKVQ